MSFTRKHQYKSMREKNRIAKRNFKAFAVFATLAIIVYLIMNRVRIKDHLMTYFM